MQDKIHSLLYHLYAEEIEKKKTCLQHILVLGLELIRFSKKLKHILSLYNIFLKGAGCARTVLY